MAVWIFIATIIAYFFIYLILALGLNIQFGYTGILNFTYILFMAIGAYVAGVTASGSPPLGISYIWGTRLPFPVPMLLGGLAAAIVGVLIGLITFRRFRSDYFAIVTFAIGFIAYDVIGNDTRLFNGFDGISAVPEPFSGVLHLGPDEFTAFFILICAPVAALLWLFDRRLYASPLGRTLRAIREDEDQAKALGKNVQLYRLLSMGLGCFYAGIGGALTVELIGAMNPSGWTTGETFIIWAALIVGGRGSRLGVLLGTLLFPTILNEGTRLLPSLQNHAELVASLRDVIIGLGLLLIMSLRPQGLLPEPRFVESPRSWWAAVSGFRADGLFRRFARGRG
jgi:ABC-type branched-subunit amino acid transport system permease subunit